jgi:hypothetical protein
MTSPTDQRLLATAKQALLYHPLSVFPGRCYFAQLPDGMIKIGYSNTIELMHRRMETLSRQYGAKVCRLADLPGGFITEALMHERFAADRIPGDGERFKPSSALLNFIACVRNLLLEDHADDEWWHPEVVPDMPELVAEAILHAAAKNRGRGHQVAQWIWRYLATVDDGQGVTQAQIVHALGGIPRDLPFTRGAVHYGIELLDRAGVVNRDETRAWLAS